MTTAVENVGSSEVRAYTIAVLLVGHGGRLSAEVISEIVLYIGECISHTVVGIWLTFFVL